MPTDPAATAKTREQVTDVAIIGAGPVGLFAIFQCGMLNLTTHVVDALDAIGGQCTALYPEKPIYDIPACPVIEAGALIELLRRQAEPFEPVYHLRQSALTIERLAGNRFRVMTAAGTALVANAVIIAAGNGAFGPNRPPLPNIDRYEGKSVFYAIGRRQDLAGKRVVIAGGGDSAVDWALSLVGVAASVTVVHRRGKFSAAPASVQRLMQLADGGEIDLVVPYQLHALQGAGGDLEAVIAIDMAGRTREICADVLLPFFGLSTDLGPLSRWGMQVMDGQLPVDPTTAETTMPGVYAIGDVAHFANKPKLILSGFAEAAIAARVIHARLRPDHTANVIHSTSRGVPGMRPAAEHRR